MKYSFRNIILAPFGWLYLLITSVRNLLFDLQLIPSKNFQLPIISVGNLAVGGTGKTPHVELLLRLLSKEYQTAVLSRGYNRKTKGFILADTKSTALTIGDEPFQIKTNFENVTVAVDEKRVNGITQLLKQRNNLQLVILDDAFQHRYVKPGLSILLTDYNRRYSHDLIMPAGNLREHKSGMKRSDIIIVTKCPGNIGLEEKENITKELNILPHQTIFFSTISYLDLVPAFENLNTNKSFTLESLGKNRTGVILVAGIVSPESIIHEIRKYTPSVSFLFFPDHHIFTESDFNKISKEYNKLTNESKIILVTQKDAARLTNNPIVPENLKQHIFTLPIQSKILFNEEAFFNQKIKDYVEKNSRNSTIH